MKRLIRTRVFAVAFFLAYFSYFAVTVFILDISGPGIGVGHSAHGFPFTYYYSHCFGGYYIYSGLLGNAVVAGIVSTIAGLAAVNLRENLSTPEFRSRWYL